MNRLNCKHCRYFRRTDQGGVCRFRGGKPTGICSVFVKVAKTEPERSEIE